MPSRHALFCYGTLCDPIIMQRVSGHASPGERANLAGYQCLALYGVPYPAIIPRRDHVTEGVLYHGLTRRHLERIARYEQRQYVRTRVLVRTRLGDRLQAWTYVLHPRYYRHILRRPWSFNTFQSRYRASYLSGLGGRKP